MEPGDERPHLPDSDPRWAEWWHFELTVAGPRAAAATGDEVPVDTAGVPDVDDRSEGAGATGVPSMSGRAGMTGSVRLCLLPHQGVARYWASLVGGGRLPVVVHDDEVPLPRPGSLEVRAEALWADHVVEAPFEQVGVGCEAFGLRLGSLADLERDPVVGERIPFGLDLEWATSPDAVPQSLGQGYRIDCQVHGEVLVADERIKVDAPGARLHAWGTHPPPFIPRFDQTTIG